MKIPSIATLEEALYARRWIVHRQPRKLNLITLRRTAGTLDAFDDMFCVVHTTPGGERVLWAARCTADPGRPSREHPRRRDGTAVMAVGQLVDGFKAGLHHGEYRCLVPAVPVPVLRYTSVDDPTGEPSTSNSTQIHRASAVRESSVVGPWSEGCVVIANPMDYAYLMKLVDAQEAAGLPRFTHSVMEWPA